MAQTTITERVELLIRSQVDTPIAIEQALRDLARTVEDLQETVARIQPRPASPVARPQIEAVPV